MDGCMYNESTAGCGRSNLQPKANAKGLWQVEAAVSRGVLRVDDTGAVVWDVPEVRILIMNLTRSLARTAIRTLCSPNPDLILR